MDAIKKAEKHLQKLEDFLLKDGCLRFSKNDGSEPHIPHKTAKSFLRNFYDIYRIAYYSVCVREDSLLENTRPGKFRSFRDVFLLCHNYTDCSIMEFLTAWDELGMKGNICYDTDLYIMWISGDGFGGNTVIHLGRRKKELNNYTMNSIIKAYKIIKENE